MLVGKVFFFFEIELAEIDEKSKVYAIFRIVPPSTPSPPPLPSKNVSFRAKDENLFFLKYASLEMLNDTYRKIHIFYIAEHATPANEGLLR